MKLLWVATKMPWPPIDGGRLLLWNSLRALAEAGEEVTLVAPHPAGEPPSVEALTPLCRPVPVAVRYRHRAADALHARLTGRPLTVVRHSLPAVRREVGRLLSEESFDAVVAEQVQALAQVEGLAKIPVLLRAQNVESDLWTATARETWWARAFLMGEGRRLAVWEGRAVGRVASTLALTEEDADRLAELAGGAPRPQVLPAPVDTELPPADDSLPGEPAVVLFGSGGWRPNQSGEGRFLHHLWPQIQGSLPEAQLHLFGGDASDLPPGAHPHPRPQESRDAFTPGSVLAVPLWVASGVRMKILEAWARGIAVVATPTAARGLGATGGEQLLLAESAEEFTAAFRALANRERYQALVQAGRRHLEERHALPRFVEGLRRILGRS